MKGDRRLAPLYQVVQIDAWAEGESGWTWNESWKLFEFRSDSLDVKRAFLLRLRRFLDGHIRDVTGRPCHVKLGRGWYYVQDDIGMLELRSRKDHRPYYACMRMTP